jgi:ABC-type proline/glycine betaine transport system ATPase subunit
MGRLRLRVEDGEFTVPVGPSGTEEFTVPRMLARLQDGNPAASSSTTAT